MYLAKMIRPVSNSAIDKIVFDYLRDHFIYGDITVAKRHQEEIVVFLFGASFLIKYLPKELLEKWLKLPIENIKPNGTYYLDFFFFSLIDCGDMPIA